MVGGGVQAHAADARTRRHATEDVGALIAHAPYQSGPGGSGEAPWALDGGLDDEDLAGLEADAAAAALARR
jgi:hypothetical protein